MDSANIFSLSCVPLLLVHWWSHIKFTSCFADKCWWLISAKSPLILIQSECWNAECLLKHLWCWIFWTLNYRSWISTGLFRTCLVNLVSFAFGCLLEAFSASECWNPECFEVICLNISFFLAIILSVKYVDFVNWITSGMISAISNELTDWIGWSKRAYNIMAWHGMATCISSVITWNHQILQLPIYTM